MSKNKIVPINNEIKMNQNDFIVSKTNGKGIITYCNEIFMQMADYNEEELLGKNHNIIRHPDMPKIAFKIAWQLIQEGEEFFGFVKNMCKDGSFYWVLANITPDYDSKGNIIGYTSVRRKPNEQALEVIIPLYAKLCSLEQGSGMSASEAYLNELLEEKECSYNELIISLQGS
jgi:PAS domain S-box-containing protein